MLLATEDSDKIGRFITTLFMNEKIVEDTSLSLSPLSYQEYRSLIWLASLPSAPPRPLAISLGDAVLLLLCRDKIEEFNNGVLKFKTFFQKFSLSLSLLFLKEIWSISKNPLYKIFVKVDVSFDIFKHCDLID